MSLAEATKTESLEKRVEELEKALRDADHEMEEVVGRMNMAQMEVADLQFERYVYIDMNTIDEGSVLTIQ
jgi:prefoldin subunit 5